MTPDPWQLLDWLALAALAGTTLALPLALHAARRDSAPLSERVLGWLFRRLAGRSVQAQLGRVDVPRLPRWVRVAGAVLNFAVVVAAGVAVVWYFTALAGRGR